MLLAVIVVFRFQVPKANLIEETLEKIMSVLNIILCVNFNNKKLAI